MIGPKIPTSWQEAVGLSTALSLSIWKVSGTRTATNTTLHRKTVFSDILVHGLTFLSFRFAHKVAVRFFFDLLKVSQPLPRFPQPFPPLLARQHALSSPLFGSP